MTKKKKIISFYSYSYQALHSRLFLFLQLALRYLPLDSSFELVIIKKIFYVI